MANADDPLVPASYPAEIADNIPFPHQATTPHPRLTLLREAVA